MKRASVRVSAIRSTKRLARVSSIHQMKSLARADLLLKVARPTQEELDWLRPGTDDRGFAASGILPAG